MEMQKVDARGMECPKPVIETKKALEQLEKGYVVTIVDNEVAKNNVVRLAEGMSLLVAVKEAGGTFEVTIDKTNTPFVMGVINEVTAQTAPQNNDVAVVALTDTFGRGSDELGAILMKSFLFTIASGDVAPKYVLLANAGVKLACKGSAVLESLQELANKGSEIIACGTCLDFFQIKDQLRCV